MTNEENECLEAYYAYERDKEVGDLVYTTPPPPEDPKSIANWGLPVNQRKFPHYPQNVKLSNGGVVRYEESLDDDAYDKFVYQEQDRIDDGFWWYNKDKLEYVTGFSYMGLQWFVMPNDETGDSSKLRFIDAQRDALYHWQWCYENETLGGVWGTCRRFGKTAWGIVIGYTIAITKFNSKCAIQSKTLGDAEGIFEKMQEYWQKMPQFLKPVDTGDTRVKNRLVFSEPKKRSSKGDKKVYGAQLNSSIFAVPSKETQLDGKRLTYGYFDEEGKTIEADINKRWSINSKCFLAKRNIVGKSLHTSTVEDMEKFGGENYKKLWDKSDKKTIDDITNRTASGLRRLFVPADYGYDVDEWGYSDRASSRRYHEAERSKLTGGDLINYIRQYPLEESEMWLMEDAGCKFSLPRLYQQRRYNEENEVDKNIRTGNLYWKNGVRFSGVVFDDNPNGRFRISYMPKQEHQCKYTIVNEHKRPKVPYFRIGVDPTDSYSPADGKGSRNGVYAVALPSALGFKCITPICEYSFRHDSPNDFYEDVLLLAFFYSAPVLVERNRGGGLMGYFEKVGAQQFIMKDPREKDIKKKKWGMASTGEDARNTLLGRAQAYVVENVGYLSGTDSFGDFPFDELILDMIDFTPTAQDSRWLKWDMVVAFMYALEACAAEFRVMDDQEHNVNLGDILNTYKIR